VAGKTGSAYLVTITDRNSRYLLAGKVVRKNAAFVANKMIKLLAVLASSQRRSIKPDRGKKSASHFMITDDFGGVQFYFPVPHAPWQRGTNANTNGLI